jgi:anaerobic selenocysteine-containing dehydrogenase
MCGLRMTVEDGRVTKVRANPDDVWSRGFLCPKGTALGELHHDPDRLRRPLVRDGDGFREVTWEEAFDEVERLLHGVIRRHGMDALTCYIGNPTAHNFSLSRYVPAFVALSGIPRVYSPGTIDQWPRNVSSALLYGGMWTFPIPDIDRTDFLVVMGANPHASQGSLLAAPDVLGRLGAIRKRGGKVVVVDPRRTGTAERADEWLPIRPGADAALLMAWVHVLFEEGLVSLGHLEGRVTGVEELRALSRDFAPEAVAEFCAIPAETIRRLARELATAERAAVYGRIGTCNQEFGTLASWLVDVVNVLTGNLDREGGSMFAKPLAWSLTGLRPPEFADGFTFGRWKSRVRGAPEVLGQVPVSCLAEEIATPGDGQLKGLVTIAGNPVLSAPEGDRLDAALPQLEAMISLDNYLNETTRHAHVVLPGLSPLDAERPHEWEILLKLAGIAQGTPARQVDPQAVDALFFAGLVATVAARPNARIEGRDAGEIVADTKGVGPDRLLDFALRTGPWGDGYGSNPEGLTLEKLAARPDGVDLGPLVPRLDEVLETPSGKVELAPAYITGDLPRLQRSLSQPDGNGLVLVSRRHVRSNNSWMHNLPSLVSGRDRCTLLVHPEDAARLGLEDGKRARVSSQAGSLTAPVEVSDEMMPGVVCLPHGWGHDKPGTRLSVAAEHAGVCNNVLAPGTRVDELSGNAAINGIPVKLETA